MRTRAAVTPVHCRSTGYGEDYEFWVEAGAATTRRDDYDEWIRHWVLDVETQEQWIAQLVQPATRRRAARQGRARLVARRRSRYPPDLDAPVNVVGARRGLGRPLPGRARCRGSMPTRCSRGPASRTCQPGSACSSRVRAGSDVQLTAEIGLWGYEATPADPFVLNHRNFPTATMLGDAEMVLGALVGGAGTTTIGCLGGAQIDRFGNVNSTRIEPRPFLVGSGGGNDVASTATENVVVATLTPQRTPADCSYITSPGRDCARVGDRPGPAREVGRSRDGRARAHGGAGGRRRRSPIGSRPPRPRVGWDLAVAAES